MINYDYNTTYKQGKLSDFLLTKAKIFDRDGNNYLDNYEYSQFQKWFTKDDIEKYSLDTINFSFKDKINYHIERSLPQNIKDNEKINDNQKKVLKVLNQTAGIGAITGLIGTLGMTTIGLKGASGTIAALGLICGISGIAVAVACGLGAWAYKNHLENKIEKNTQQESSSNN